MLTCQIFLGRSLSPIGQPLTRFILPRDWAGLALGPSLRTLAVCYRFTALRHHWFAVPLSFPAWVGRKRCYLSRVSRACASYGKGFG